MSTEQLSREQACDKFIKQKMRDGAGGLNRIISRSAFGAGWSARDAEVERLRAACQHVFEMIEVELYESAEDDQWHIAAAKLRDALKQEPA